MQILQLDDAGVPVDPVRIVDLDTSIVDEHVPHRAPAPVTIGVTTGSPSGVALHRAQDLTFTLVPTGSEPLGPACIAVPDPVVTAEALRVRGARVPRTTVAMDGLLRMTAALDVEEAVTAESFAYSMLLGGPEFSRWRASRPVRDVTAVPEPVAIERDGDLLRVRLNHPERRNAFGRRLRAALVDALRLADVDHSIHHIEMTGEGPHFCTGGDLDEFGLAADLSAAHAIRLDQSAGLAVHRLGGRIRATVHGACVGAGIEVPAFSQALLARPGTTFRLPELDMGLVPGAGGTVSLTRRIGRWRTAFMVLSGEPIDLDTALAWGLVDDVVD